MKLPLILPALVLASVISLSTACVASAADRASNPQEVLQIEVRIPPTWEPMLEDRISERFVDQIREVFQREGFRGQIREVHTGEANPGQPLLTIFLTQWEVNHIGTITCSFSAGLQSANGMRSLGAYSGTALRWMSGPGRFGLADSLDNAATEAIRQLFNDVAETELVPRLRRR